MSASRMVSCYFASQAVAVVAWWGMLWTIPGSYAWFLPPGGSREDLVAFWLPDLLLLAGGSAVAAGAAWRHRTWAPRVMWLVVAAAAYPTLWCVATSVRTGRAWPAAAAMATAAGLTLAFTTVYGDSTRAPAAIRVQHFTARAAWGWTLAQTCVFWSVFLWVLPCGLFELQRAVGVPAFHHPAQAAGSAGLFVAASVLGLWTGHVMAYRGRGTPLPTATAPHLVVVGPYRRCRNPMALAGIAQGLSVGWFLGSVAVLAYALVGALLWHVAVRPVEEADLRQRFGSAYEHYRVAVPLWRFGFSSRTSDFLPCNPTRDTAKAESGR